MTTSGPAKVWIVERGGGSYEASYILSVWWTEDQAVAEKNRLVSEGQYPASDLAVYDEEVWGDNPQI